MGNASCSASVPIRIAAGLAKRGFIPSIGSPVGESVINLSIPETVFVRISSEADIACGSVSSICVKEREDTESWVILNPDYVDKTNLIDQLKHEVAANLFSIQNTDAFVSFLNKIKGKTGIESAGMLANVIFGAIDLYVTPASISQYVHATYSNGLTIPSSDPTENDSFIFHAKGSIKSWELAAATSSIQNLNTILIKNALMSVLSQDATLNYIMCQLNIDAASLMHGDRVARSLIMIVLIASLFIGGILIYHCLNVRQKFREVFCPADVTKYEFTCNNSSQMDYM